MLRVRFRLFYPCIFLFLDEVQMIGEKHPILKRLVTIHEQSLIRMNDLLSVSVYNKICYICVFTNHAIH